jgi:hypothetical protein
MDAYKTIKAILISGLVYLIASQVFGIITQLILPYDWATIGGMRSFTDPLMVLMYLSGFVMAIGAVVLYQYTNLKGELIQKGAKFGVLMWLATNLPSAFIIYVTMTYPLGFHLDNLVFGLLDWILMGIAITWVLDKPVKKLVKKKKK